MDRNRVNQFIFLFLVLAGTGGLIYWYALRHPYKKPLPGKAEYGYQLITQTSDWYGQGGRISIRSNGMNCSHCHLDAGKNLQAIPLTSVFKQYPRFRDRSGTKESLFKRVKDCFERSLQTTAPDSSSREFQAIEAYLKWLEENSPVDSIPREPLTFLPRAADYNKGSRLFDNHCSRCHGWNGKGLSAADRISYRYPPLWGLNSYSTGAGMYQVTKLARFIKYNMPYDKPPGKILLTDEEAYDLAAYINSQERRTFDISQDWPLISTKPVDYPFGPYADSFSAERHKYGPWLNMK
jgi:thiosulfate dehydrogenase